MKLCFSSGLKMLPGADPNTCDLSPFLIDFNHGRFRDEIRDGTRTESAITP